MRVVIMTKPEADEKTIKAEKFDTKDQAQAQTFDGYGDDTLDRSWCNNCFGPTRQ